jgi:hypothetical protein
MCDFKWEGKLPPNFENKCSAVGRSLCTYKRCLVVMSSSDDTGLNQIYVPYPKCTRLSQRTA